MKLIQRLFKRSSRKNRDRAGSSGTDVSLSSTTNPVGTQEDRAEYSERCRSGEIHNLNTTQEHLQGSIFSPGIEDRLGSTVMSSHKERAPQLPVEVFFDHVYHFLGEEGLRKAREVCICWQFEGAWKLLAIDRWNELRRTPILDDPWINPHPERQKPKDLKHGLRDIVEGMSVKCLKKHLRRLAPRPERIIASVVEKPDLVREVMGWMLLTRKGFRCHGSELPEDLPTWAKRIPGWRWSYLYVKLDGLRRWCTEEDIMRREWTMVHGVEDMTCEVGPCIFHPDGTYTSPGGLARDAAGWETVKENPLTLQRCQTSKADRPWCPDWQNQSDTLCDIIARADKLRFITSPFGEHPPSALQRGAPKASRMHLDLLFGWNTRLSDG